ncbi:hypothetical protein ACFLWK_01740 [Chloroflexota bacterium]
MKISFISDTCCGCRLCELACSFHHRQAFSPDESSIEVFRDNEQGKATLTIDDTCDQCDEEAEPLCVTYCLYQALTIEGESETENE